MRLAPLLLACASLAGQTPDPKLAREVLKELVSLDTTAEHGDTTPAARALAKRFLDAGFPAEDVKVLGPTERNQNLVVRFRGTGKAGPILLLDHLDVVEARRADWTVDPFALTEKDGYLYGRGTEDIKGEAAIQVATLIALKREGFRPGRDLILALTAGEEGSGAYDGVEWLLKEHRDLLEAEYCLNGDGGITHAKGGKAFLRAFQTSEKGFAVFELEARNPGGHSSLPRPDNAITQLARALEQLAGLRFPLTLDETRRAFLHRMAEEERGPKAADLRTVSDPAASPAAVAEAEARLSADPYLNAQMRTTVVPTLLSGGHAVNALPQRAVATVNARLLPGERIEDVEAAIRKAVEGTGVAVLLKDAPGPNPASPLRPELLRALQATTSRLWPGVPVVPAMDTGGSDGKFLRAAGIPTYGISGIPIDEGDDRSHGQDERIRATSFAEGLKALDLLLRELAGPGVP